MFKMTGSLAVLAITLAIAAALAAGVVIADDLDRSIFVGEPKVSEWIETVSK